MSTGSFRAVLVGRRQAAFAACEAEGLTVHQVSERPPRRAQPNRSAPASYHRLALDAPESSWRRLAAELGGDGGVRAVLAATEPAVMPAAWIRDELGLPGVHPEAARLCSDKLLMKRAIRRAGLPCARYVAGGDGEAASAELLEQTLGLPLVLKRRVGAGGRETRILHSREELPRQLEDGWMAESFVTGTEMSVETLVHAGAPRFLNFTEYLEPRWANVAPARIDPGPARRLTALNRAAIGALRVDRGVTHLEVFLTRQGVVFGEIAARPPGGHIMDLLGLAYAWDPWRAWVRVELGLEPGPPPVARGAAGAWVLHPGRGRVATVEGVAEARDLPGVEVVRLRVAPGSEIAERRGVGQEVGFILVRGADRDQVERRLRRAREAIRIEMVPGSAPPEAGC